MAGLSPSPSGSSRRLSELLEEQQEPFSLDLYLLEKGCSPSALDAAGGCSVASLPCWPRSRGTSLAPRWATASSRRTPAIGLLSKFLRTAAAPAPTTTRNNKKLRPAAIGLCSVKGEKTASKTKNALPSSSLGATVKARKVEAEDEEEEDDDDGSSKQLSPVSVLEHRTFEKPPREYTDETEAIVVFRELLDAACKPALRELLARESSESKDVLTETSTTTTTTTAAPPARRPTRNDRGTSAAHLEDIFEAEWHEHDLVPLDMAGARAVLGDARLGRWDVGAELAVAVLEALTEEAVVELMGMARHDDANADERCWLLPNC